MEVRIEKLPQKILVEKRMRMFRKEDKTVDLFRRVKPQLKLMKGKLNATIGCLQVYEGSLPSDIVPALRNGLLLK